MLKLIIMIKNNLSKIMGEKRIRIVELHRMTGLSQPTIINLYYEKSKNISLETVDKICTALEISVGELFEHTSD